MIFFSLMHKDVVLFNGIKESQAEVLKTLRQKCQVQGSLFCLCGFVSGLLCFQFTGQLMTVGLK